VLYRNVTIRNTSTVTYFLPKSDEVMVEANYYKNLIDGAWHNATLKIQTSTYPDEWRISFYIDGEEIFRNIRLSLSPLFHVKVPPFYILAWVGNGLVTRPLYSQYYVISPFRFKYNSMLDISNVSLIYVNRTESETLNISFLNYNVTYDGTYYRGWFSWHYSDLYVNNGNTQYKEGDDTAELVSSNIQYVQFYDEEKSDRVGIVGDFNIEGSVLGVSGYGLPYVLMPEEDVVLVLKVPRGKVVPGQSLLVNIHTASGGNYVAIVTVP